MKYKIISFNRWENRLYESHQNLLNPRVQLWLFGTDNYEWIIRECLHDWFGFFLFFFFFCISISCNMQNQSHFSKMWLSFPLQIQASWWNGISAVVGVLEMISYIPHANNCLAFCNALCILATEQRWKLRLSIGWLVNIHRQCVSDVPGLEIWISLQSNWAGKFLETSWLHCVVWILSR